VCRPVLRAAVIKTVHTRAATPPTAFTSKIRRFEETKLQLRSAAAGRRPATSESENRKYEQHAIKRCLYLRFTDSLTREARRGGHAVSCPAGALSASRDFSLRFSFDSSSLRFFDGNRGTCHRDSERRHNRNNFFAFPYSSFRSTALFGDSRRIVAIVCAPWHAVPDPS